MNELKLKQIFASLIFAAICVQMLAFNVNAQLLRRDGKSDESGKTEQEIPAAKYKIAPDLEEKTNDLMAGRQADQTQKVIIQLKSETGLNDLFGNSMSAEARGRLIAEEVENNKNK